MNTLSLIYAIRARKARKELLSLAIEHAKKTATKLSGIDKTSHLSQIGTIGSKLLDIGKKCNNHEEVREEDYSNPSKLFLYFDIIYQMLLCSSRKLSIFNFQILNNLLLNN